MSNRLLMYEREYRRSLAGALIGSLVVHLLLLLGPCDLSPNRRSGEERIHLGYRGPTHVAPELEVFEPNTVQSYFYQRQREGGLRAREYRVAQPLDLTPGPEPLPRPRREKPRPQPTVTPGAGPEPIEPLPGLHQEISYSEEFVILKLVKPIYPEYELSQHIGARLLVAVRITPEGSIDEEQVQEARAEPLRASTRGFELAALEALRQWKVRLPKRYEQSQGCWLTIPIEFRPEDRDFLNLDSVRVR